MALHQQSSPETLTHTKTEPGWRRGVEWALAVVGAIALFLGLFITFAGESQSLGISGDWSWEVGEIDAVWQYGFLIGGAVLLLIGVAMILTGRRDTRH